MNKLRVGINGFGRIGRQVLKAMRERHADELEVVAVNDLFDIATNVHLLEFDTNYGRSPFEVRAEGDEIHFGGWRIKSLAHRDPKEIPWGSLGVDLVIECTGIFASGPKSRAHLEAGARKVIISTPAKEVDLTVVIGVNDKDYDPARHDIVSNASCTTNCLAPVAKVVHEAFGIVSGLMCTVHAYTNDQRILDLAHRDLRRARAAGQNIIPTSTGAARAVALVIPELQGRIDGYSLRVPTPTVSVVDFACLLERGTTTKELLSVLHQASEGPLKGVLGYNERPLVSMDFKGDPHSGIVEASQTRVQHDTMAKVVAWYDNEWGYSCRIADLAAIFHARGM